MRSNALTVEAWDGKTFVGLVAGYLNTAERSSYITNVGVLPSFARKGVATKLLDAFVEHAKTASIEMMALEVSKASPAAMHLFSKFEIHAIEDPGDYLMMRAPLARK